MMRAATRDQQFESMLAQLGRAQVHDPDYGVLRIVLPRTPRVALDVGANRGQSIISLKALFPELVIHAFEANPLFDACLQHLTKHFGSSVRIHSFGLGAVPGRIPFYVPWVGDEPYLEEASTRLDNFEKPWVVERFRSRGDLRLEHGMVDIRVGDALGLSPDIVKVDVEGAERDVLAGLRETIRRCRPTLLVENSDWDGVTSLLAELDYAPFRFDAEREALVPYSGTSTNAFYLHRPSASSGA